jgi:cyclic pyranopterin phosphate synthase
MSGTNTGRGRTPQRDSHGRPIDYLRISLTDHCNLRCIYCMPEHGAGYVDDAKLLSASEIETVARAAAALGFRKIRLTGGEPTLRRDLLDIVGRLAAIDGLADLAMTTNGLRLPRLGCDLASAGLHRVNVHIDTLNEQRLPLLMRWGTVPELMAGLEAAEDAGLEPLKINAVVVRDYNDADVAGLARLTLDHPWAVRFIELMPIGSGAEAQVAIDRFVPSSETAARIEAELGPLEPVPADGPADEARYHRLAGAPGRVGFISPVSQPYCDTCNRMRLTADGRLHLCLLRDDEIDLRPALRDADVAGRDERVRDLLCRAVGAKPVGHKLGAGVHTLGRRMHAIGG